ncbi:hypothetical protein FOZ63_019212, partial [Perkinsus olseni]
NRNSRRTSRAACGGVRRLNFVLGENTVPSGGQTGSSQAYPKQKSPQQPRSGNAPSVVKPVTQAGSFRAAKYGK